MVATDIPEGVISSAGHVSVRNGGLNGINPSPFLMVNIPPIFICEFGNGLHDSPFLMVYTTHKNVDLGMEDFPATKWSTIWSREQSIFRSYFDRFPTLVDFSWPKCWPNFPRSFFKVGCFAGSNDRIGHGKKSSVIGRLLAASLR